MSSCNLAVSISLLACSIAENKTADELALISSFFNQLGDTIETIAAQQVICSSEDNN